MSFMNSILATGDAQEPTINALRDSGKPVVIYGASVYAYVLHQYLEALGIHVRELVVDRQYLSSPTFMGLKVSAFEDIEENLHEYQLVLGITNYPAVLERCAKRGIHDIKVIDVPDFLNIPERFMDREYVEEHQAEFEAAGGLFADDLSRDTFIAAINAKVTQDVSRLQPVVRADHLYFPTTEFGLGSDEVLLDVGGFDGDSIRDFVSLTKGNFKHIYSLEPFAENYGKLEDTIRQLGLEDRCDAIRVGAWDKRETLSFERTERGIDNKISKSGGDSIEVDRIDSIARDFAHPVSLMKMDINGAELKALQGARETILNHHPRIAVKMHVKDHFYQIPRLLKEMAPDMKLYLRQRNFMSMMLVLYGTFE